MGKVHLLELEEDKFTELVLAKLGLKMPVAPTGGN